MCFLHLKTNNETRLRRRYFKCTHPYMTLAYIHELLEIIKDSTMVAGRTSLLLLWVVKSLTLLTLPRTHAEPTPSKLEYLFPMHKSAGMRCSTFVTDLDPSRRCFCTAQPRAAPALVLKPPRTRCASCASPSRRRSRVVTRKVDQRFIKEGRNTIISIRNCCHFFSQLFLLSKPDPT